jgi:hypothetical protein
MNTSQPRLRRTEASQYLLEKWGIERTPGTLAKIACCSSSGPRFQHAGRIPLYPISELDAWAQLILSPLKSSTSDHGGPHAA